jgi:hypothetical protein
MEQSGFITVENSRNHYNDFVNFMSATTNALISDGRMRKDYYITRNGDKLEQDVLQCMKAKATDFHFNPELIRHTDAQHFPDIISNRYFGVEVKTTKKDSWQSIGSSIVESLRDEHIKKIFMLFGILSPNNIDFRCKPYEKCLSEISVTHSPRYVIDMDLKESDKTIFDKMNIDYESFRKLGDTQIDKVRAYYRQKYRNVEAKTMPWWLGNATETPEYELRVFSDLPESVKNFYLVRCYALFPEILGTSIDKFRKPTLWMCSRHSIICSNIRDLFTAGGTGNIYVDDMVRWKNVPKVICNLLPYLHEISRLYSTKEDIKQDYEDYSVYSNTLTAEFSTWKRSANMYIQETLLSKRLTYKITVDDLLNYRFCRKTDYLGKPSFFLM